jgi:hypothetical protein
MPGVGGWGGFVQRLGGRSSPVRAPKSKSPGPLVAVVLALAAISVAAARWTLVHGYTLYDGDAEAHLDIARRILDSRTPGPEQLGTVWLPLPHLLMLPFVMHNAWWRSGLAGVIPSAVCFVLAGAFLFAAARRAYSSVAAGLAVALLFALNPNILYLQSTPMTETVLLAAVAALLWATLWFRDSQSIWAIAAAAVASNAASLTRYEGWFLIPFVSLYLWFAARRKWHALIFAALASLGPLAWLAHNQYYYSNPLEFYNGPWSTMAIHARELARGVISPTDHNWMASIHYYFEASRLVVGGAVLALGAIGAAVALAAGAAVARLRWNWWPLVFLALCPAFYIWSLHSAGADLYVPTLWPHTAYDTRYAIAVLPWAAFAAGALTLLIPDRIQSRRVPMTAVVLGAAFAGGLMFLPGGIESTCWREAAVNSAARRTWTREAASYLGNHYDRGTGILYSFGDLTAVLREAGIPLRDGLHDGNHPAWDLTMARPRQFLAQEWVLAFSGDQVANLLSEMKQPKETELGMHYQLQKQIAVEGARVVEIYQRKP